MERRYIYEVEPKRMYNQALKLLENSKISNENKETILEFSENLISKSCSYSRIGKMIRQLRILCEFLIELDINKSIKILDKKEITKLVAYINNLENIKPCTKADYRKAIIQFYLWYKDEDELIYSENKEISIQRRAFYNFLKKDVKRTYRKERIESSSILTDEDIKEVIKKGCRTHREKAIIKVLHESGFRIEEFLNIRIKDIVFKPNCVEISVNGKTGLRTIPLVSSMAYLHKHLDEFEDKDPNTLIWLSKSMRTIGKPLKYKGMCKLINNCFNRAKCYKKHNPHWFRHSRASILAPELKEAMMCEYFGWTLGSNQVKTYVHLDKKQLKNVCLSYNGIVTETETKKDKPQICNCGILNESSAKYCFKCGQPLSVSVIIQDKNKVDNEINKTMEFFMEMIKNPEIMKRFEEFKAKIE